jgi:hypothetical protein
MLTFPGLGWLQTPWHLLPQLLLAFVLQAQYTLRVPELNDPNQQTVCAALPAVLLQLQQGLQD